MNEVIKWASRAGAVIIAWLCQALGGWDAALGLLFLLPRAGITWGVVFGRAGPLMVAGRAALSRPPSLLVLCISRT